MVYGSNPSIIDCNLGAPCHLAPRDQAGCGMEPWKPCQRFGPPAPGSSPNPGILCCSPHRSSSGSVSAPPQRLQSHLPPASANDFNMGRTESLARPCLIPREPIRVRQEHHGQRQNLTTKFGLGGQKGKHGQHSVHDKCRTPGALIAKRLLRHCISLARFIAGMVGGRLVG